jgi:hypothetical protein
MESQKKLFSLSLLSMPTSAAQENMSAQHDASLFAFGSHNKKRPHNITFGQFTWVGLCA